MTGASIIQRAKSPLGARGATKVPAGPVRNAWALLRSLAGSPSSGALWTNGQDRVVRFYRSGTHALAAGIRMVAKAHQGSHVTVWVPAYFCDYALRLVRELDVVLKYYPIQRDLRPDWERIDGDASRMGQPQVFLLVHYFGFPAAAEEARTFCNLHRMILFEDAAHILQPIGALGRGDFLLFCPHKFLAVPPVGVLITEPRWVGGHEDAIGDAELGQTLLWAGRWLAKQARNRLRVRWPTWRGDRRPDPMPPEPTLKAPGAAATVQGNPLTLRLLGRAEEDLKLRPRTIIERRREHYLTLLGWLNGLAGVFPLVPILPSGVCPLVLPVIAEGGSRGLVRRLRAHGIPAFRWWGPPPEVATDPTIHRVALTYYDEMFSLPVHQGLDVRHIEVIGQSVVTAAAAAPEQM